MSDGDLRHVRTRRLRLDAVGPRDVDEVFALNSDPALWTVFPSGRHTDREQTREQVEQFAAAWDADGLGYWVARPLDGGAVLGVGGCTVRHGAVWNVYYRFATAAHGRGYAGELARAAVDAARTVRPDLPVVAYLLRTNEPSRRVAERLGLRLVWQGPDVGNPDPTQVRLVLADRPLAPVALEAVSGAP